MFLEGLEASDLAPVFDASKKLRDLAQPVAVWALPTTNLSSSRVSVRSTLEWLLPHHEQPPRILTRNVERPQPCMLWTAFPPAKLAPVDIDDYLCHR